MAKANHNSTVGKVRERTLLTFQEERDKRFGYRLKPITEEYLKGLGDELISWTKSVVGKGRYISLRRFLQEKDIYEQTMTQWRARCPYLDACVQQAKLIMGATIEEGLMNKNFSEKGSLLQLHHYLPEWEKMDAYHANLKKDSNPATILLGQVFNTPVLTQEEAPVQTLLPSKEAQEG